LGYLEQFHQAIAVHNLKSVEKSAAFLTLRRLAGIHGRLPLSMIVREKIETEIAVLASGGFSDLRFGRYMGHFVAVKSLRVAETDDRLKIRKVIVNVTISANWGVG
jgi:hypothetical protein